MTGTRCWGGWLAIVGAFSFCSIVIALHFLQPDYDARYQLMSELALGRHGWAMLPAFCCFALSIIGLQVEVRRFRASGLLKAMLLGAAVALVGAGIFRLGQATELHVGLVAFAFVLLILAIYLFPSQVGGLAWRPLRAVCWLLAASAAVSVALGQSLLPMGIAQRFAVTSVLVWLCLMGWILLRRAPGMVRS
ncbi:MAG: DUF998 domain-containing protein [Acidiferrobacterales bacterium]